MLDTTLTIMTHTAVAVPHDDVAARPSAAAARPSLSAPFSGLLIPPAARYRPTSQQGKTTWLMMTHLATVDSHADGHRTDRRKQSKQPTPTTDKGTKEPTHARARTPMRTLFRVDTVTEQTYNK